MTTVIVRAFGWLVVPLLLLVGVVYGTVAAVVAR